IITDFNHDINGWLTECRDAGLNLRMESPAAPPANGQGPAAPVPSFTRVKTLTADGHPSSLIGRQNPGLAVAGSPAQPAPKTAVKRKVLPDGGTSNAVKRVAPRPPPYPPQWRHLTPPNT
ncbi:unnamed protein product, partial [Sphacelaria rigidula]